MQFLKLSIVSSMLLTGFPSLQAKIDYKLLREFNHDANSFTQGLIIKDGYIYESGGLYAKSTIRKVDPKTGKVLQMKKLPKHFFAEGITIINGLIYMLTWRENTLLILDQKTFELKDMRSYKTHTGQGWGIAFDGKNLITSDGSHILTKFKLPPPPPPSNIDNDIETHKPLMKFGMWRLAKPLELIEQIPVIYKGKPLKKINDLEYVNGKIYANIWYEDVIVEIDPNTGTVLNVIDMSDLWPMKSRPRTADCLNGIAYNQTDHSFLLTGKLWNKYYHVSFNKGSGDL